MVDFTKTCSLAIVFVAFTSLASWSQGALEGVVMDQQGAPIEHAHCVVGQSMVTTDAEGRFRFEAAPHRMGQEVKLAVSHVGFNSVEVRVVWPSLGVRVLMEPASEALLPALVTSSSTSTHFSSVAEIRKLEANAWTPRRPHHESACALWLGCIWCRLAKACSDPSFAAFPG